MATIWSKLGKLGPKWVIPGSTVAFSFIVLVFGYIFETTYYASFGIDIENHVSQVYFASAALRYPVTFAWSVLFAAVFAVDLSLLFETRTLKEGWKQLLLLVALLYGAYLVVSGDAKDQAETLKPIEIRGSGNESHWRPYLLVGNIESKLVVCDAKDGSVEMIEPPTSIRFPKSDEGKVEAKRCWRSAPK